MKLKVKNEEIPRIEKGRMFFVDRESAVIQLQRIHQSNFERALAKAGSDWKIPICDNIFGLGKSELAQKYVEFCKVSKSSKQDLVRLDFKEMLSKAITVHIIFKEAELRKEDLVEGILLKKLQDALIPLFEIAPPCLYKSSYPNTADFLSDLIAEIGPVFIALDEIGLAFHIQDRNDTERRNLFLRFCDVVLRNWLLVPKLFFLVLGRGSFLNYVGCRPGNIKLPKVSPFSFERLILQFLRPKSIKEILHRTYFGEETLFDYYKLTDAQADVLAERLFLQTTGNPRFLLNSFQQSTTKEILMEYVAPSQITNYHEFFTYAFNFKKEITNMLLKAESRTCVDLSMEIISQERSIPLEIIANNAFIAWEGELEAAQLTASPATIKFMATYFFPLNEFFELILRNSLVPLDFPEAFEVMLVKRFQQIFATPQCSKTVLPSFFDSPSFGVCEDLVLCDEVRSMPQIIPGGGGVRLQDSTADKAAWPLLLKQMDAYPSLCLKPPPRSASSDALFVGNVGIASVVYRYTFAIAAKNYDKSTTAGQRDIEEECQKFNVMFEGSACKQPSRLNVLFFCATRYAPEVQKSFGEKKIYLSSTSAWKHIDEVIVLDLSTKENREEFFGLSPSSPLNQAIQLVISKASTVYSTKWSDDE